MRNEMKKANKQQDKATQHTQWACYSLYEELTNNYTVYIIIIHVYIYYDSVHSDPLISLSIY